MLIAIPMKDAVLQPQFDDSVKVFEIADLDFDNKTIVSRKTVDFSADSLALPELLNSQEVSVVICGMISESLHTRLALAGIEILAGAPAAAPDDLYKALFEGAVADGCGCGGCDCECVEPEQGGGGCDCGSCGCH
jgi:predicted Fe-Mo cluster-binding NifX family protein